VHCRPRPCARSGAAARSRRDKSPDRPPRRSTLRRGGLDRDLLSGPIDRTLLLFALPTLASSALQSASGSLDTLRVGRFLGEEALAATANGNIVMFLLVAFGFGPERGSATGIRVRRRAFSMAAAERTSRSSGPTR